MGKKKRAVGDTSSVTAAPCHLPLKGKAEGRTIAVTHPTHGAYTAEGVKDRLQAVQMAARAWGGLQWSKIARECEFKEVKADVLDRRG